MNDFPVPARGRLAARDLVGGGLISGFGIVALILSQSYQMGSLIQMGPGYFPAALAILLIGLGVAVMAIEPMAAAVPKIPLRSLAAISAGVLAFAFTIESLGLVVAVISSMLLSSLAVSETKPMHALIGAGVMALACVAVFDWGLGLQLRAFG